MKRFARLILLFIVGVLLTYVTHFVKNKTGGIFYSGLYLFGCFGPSIWLPLTIGICAALVGWLYPCLDMRLGDQMSLFYQQDWESVLRCFALFLGINAAPDKLDFNSESQLQLSLFGMCMGLWWLFDHSYYGLGLTTITSCTGTLSYKIMEYIGLYQISQPGLVCWLPAVLFSGAVTIGLIGRQLAKPDILKKNNKNPIQYSSVSIQTN